MKQSTPLSYLTVQAISTDGAAHTVSVYSDISAEWACASNNTEPVVWQSNVTGPILTHQVMLETQQNYTEYNDFILREFVMLVSPGRVDYRAVEGAAYYSTTNVCESIYPDHMQV